MLPATSATPFFALCDIALAAQAPVVLPAKSNWALATPFMEWDAEVTEGAPTSFSAPQWKMVEMFLANCSLSSAPADVLLFNSVTPLNLRLNAGFWSRLLATFVAGGLLRSNISTRHRFLEAMRQFEPSDAKAMIIVGADLVFVEPREAAGSLDEPYCYVPGTATHRHAPSLVAAPSLPLLEVCADEQPLLAVAFLSGVLGACLASTARVLPSLQKYIGSGYPDDTSLARLSGNLLNFSFDRIVGPFIADSLAHRVLVIETLDTFRYRLRAFEDVAPIEVRRTVCAQDTAPTLRQFFFAISFLSGTLGACLQKCGCNDSTAEDKLYFLIGTLLNISFGQIIRRFVTDWFVHRVLVIEALNAFGDRLRVFEEDTAAATRQQIGLDVATPTKEILLFKERGAAVYQRIKRLAQCVLPIDRVRIAHNKSATLEDFIFQNWPIMRTCATAAEVSTHRIIQHLIAATMDSNDSDRAAAAPPVAAPLDFGTTFSCGNKRKNSYAFHFTQSYLYLSSTELYINLRVWDLPYICGVFNLNRGAHCWPFLLAGKGNSMSACRKKGKHSHKTPLSSAHQAIPGFDPTDEATCEKFSRNPTTKEVADNPLRVGAYQASKRNKYGGNLLDPRQRDLLDPRQPANV